MGDIKKLRNETGMSQSKFAKEFDIPVNSLQNWETGRRKPPEYVYRMLEKAVDEWLINHKNE
jgi:DNA-binding transcriptional regulator YiaG